MNRVFRSIAICLCLFVASLAAHPQTPPAQTQAAEILRQAEATAASQQKNVLLVFSASWCGPCHMFEALLKDPGTAPIIDKYFAIARLDVGEHKNDAHHANTPGADALESSLGGAEAGYPFIVFLDPPGKPIVNSFRPVKGHPTGDNIGYPALPEEIDWFMQMLHQGAPAMSSKEAAVIQKWLQSRGHS